MDKPQLTVLPGGLKIDFPGWDPKQIDAVRGSLIAWKRRGTALNAEGLLIAQWEAKETFPNLRVDGHTRDLLRGLYHCGTGANEESWDLEGLFPVQRKPTARLCGMDKALLTAAPGLGKTIMTLTALRNRFVDLAVIVVPLTSLDGWAKEIQQWYTSRLDSPRPVGECLRVWRSFEDVYALPERVLGPLVILTTPNVITAIAERFTGPYGTGLDGVFFDGTTQNTFLILDESYLYQNRKAGRTDDLNRLAVNFKCVWLLSGMPVSKVNDDLFSQLRLLYPKTFTSYWNFARRYCLVQDDYWGTKIVGNKPGSEELLKRDLEDILIPCDYPTDGPGGWIPVDLDIPMTEKQEAIYIAAKEKLWVEANILGRDKPLGIKRKIELTTRLLQIASNPLTLGGDNSSGKWDELLFERLRSDPWPCLIWVKYIATAEALSNSILHYYPHHRLDTLTGSTKPKDRFAKVERFQNGELDILILNDSVGKYSLTLTAARTVFYLERNFDAEAYYQSLFRVRRITSPHPVRMVFLRSTYRNGKPTVDHLVHKALLERSQNAQILTVGELLGEI